MIRQRSTPLLLLAALLLAGLASTAGCAQIKNAKVDSRYELTRTLQNFHRDMRWGEFERAANIVHPSHKQAFLGRYEEHGKDFDIVGLEVKQAIAEAINIRRVEVQQKWIVEPDMTVKEKRFVEIWKRTDRGWMLRRRMRKDDWKERREQIKEEWKKEQEDEESPEESATADASSP